MAESFDIIIVGAGTAGMTAALYALRNGKSVLILEKDTFGGQIALSPKVENFPTQKTISGAEFSDIMFEQITQLGVKAELEKVESITKTPTGFFVTTDYNTYTAKSIILATGVKHRQIGVLGEEELVGKGVSYCATCDGPFFAGEEVVVIGDANTALQYSIMLTGYCKKVTVCTLFDKFFGESHLVRTLKSKPNVEIFHNLNLQQFFSKDGYLTGLRFEKTDSGESKIFDTRAVFICVGQMSDNAVFEKLVNLDKNGFIVANEECKTSRKGVYAAGDCRTKKVRQLTTAAADGAAAALAACSYLDSLDAS